MKTLYKISLLFIFGLVFAGFAPAQNNSEKGIELYKKGDFQGAIEVLKNSNGAEDLYYLGLAYEKSNEIGKAKDVFNKLFAESYDIFFKRFDEWQKIYNDASKQSFAAFLLEVKANNLIGFSAAEKAFGLKSKIFQTNDWRFKANILADTVELGKTREEIYSNANKPISTIEFIKKPRVVHPKDGSGNLLSRENAYPGKEIIVSLFVVYGADGRIKLLIPTENLIDAFTVQGLKAAGAIKFNPAIKDGKPVSYRSRIQYSFSTY